MQEECMLNAKFYTKETFFVLFCLRTKIKSSIIGVIAYESYLYSVRTERRYKQTA